MDIEVEKIYQSPCTPVQELTYLVKITNYDDKNDYNNNVVKFLEEKVIKNI